MKTKLSLLMLTALTLTAVTVQGQGKTTGTTNTGFVVNNYTQPGLGSVNSYYIATDAGVILIDTQRDEKPAANLLEQLKATGKPVIAVILTHEHPDHLGGLALIAKEYPDAPIYAAQSTLDSITTGKQGFEPPAPPPPQTAAKPEIPRPNKIVRSCESFTVGGVTFEPLEIGAGEAENMLMLFVPAQNVLFSGDLIGTRMTPFLLNKHSANWIRQLAGVEKIYGRVATVYPGHGSSGKPKELMSAQRRYITDFRKLVAKAVSDGTVSPLEKQRIITQTNQRYPGYLPVADIPDLLERNVDAVASEITGEKARGQ